MNRSTHSTIWLTVCIVIAASMVSSAQDRGPVSSSGIRIGEKLTYNISFQKYDTVGYAEMYAVSRGKLGDVDALELRMKIKTTGLLSAAFYQADEVRTTFANPETGAPLLVRRQDNSGVSVREIVTSYLAGSSSGFDLLTLMYHARQSAGSGSFLLAEGDKSYSITFSPLGAEHIRSDAGEFDTTVSTVQSDYLTEHQVQTMKVNFSADEAHIPVMIRLKTTKGEFRIVLSGEQIIEPEVEATVTPTAVPTPKPVSTPRPTPTPIPYVPNQALSPELGFQIGEKLTYRISTGSRELASIMLQAKERKLVGGEDSLVLSANVISAEPGNGLFFMGDTITARVNPETLAPFELASRMSGPLANLNQLVRFDQKTGSITAGPTRVDGPIGTHSFLSLLYALRSFNLTPSKDIRNPVNDTRVAVFWQDKAYIFMLRPFEPETITVNGQKMLAQKVSIKTNVPQLDQLGINIWLTPNGSRIPLLISYGPYQVELIASTKSL